jgi:hypothetical protein
MNTAVDSFLGGQAATASAPDNIVILPSGDVDNRKCAEQLASRLNRGSNIYSHHGTVVEAKRGENGEMELSSLRPDGAATRFQQWVLFFHWRRPDDKPVLAPAPKPPLDTMRELLAGGVLASHLRKVELLSPCPILVPSDAGQLETLGPGYHAVHRVLVDMDAPPAHEMTVTEALTTLDELTAEYTFETPGDHARMVADYITPAPVAGDLLGAQAPISITEANESQSGKGYHQRIVRALYRSRTSHVTQRKGGVGSFDEDICAAAVHAKMFMSLDNHRGKLDSPLLESALTAEKDTVQVRLPHIGQVNTSFRRRVIQLTSNGLLTTPDLANRANLVRIRKRHGLTFRKYPEGDLEAHIIANQPRYLGAVFVLVKAWHAAGEPCNHVPGHDRRRWAGVIDWILRGPLLGWFGGLMDGMAEAKERLSNPDQSWLRSVCVALERERLALAVEYRANELAAFCANHDITIPGARSEGGDGANGECAAIGRIMGRLFRKANGDILLCQDFGFVVTRTQSEETGPDRHKITVKTYRFTSTRQSAPDKAEGGSEWP